MKRLKFIIEELEKEIIADKKSSSSDNDEYGWINKRLAGKEKAKEELEKIVWQWKMKLSRVISGNQEEKVAYVEERRELNTQIPQESYGIPSSSKKS